MISYFIQGLLLGFPAAATPGPLQAYFLGQTMKNGWRRTLPSAFAPLISDGPIVLVVAVLLAQTPEWFLISLRFAGGLFILYLAFDAIRAVRSAEADYMPSPDLSNRGILKAALTNLLSPNPYIFWTVVAGPILLDAWRQTATYGLGFLLGFYGTLIGGFAMTIMVFAAIGRLNWRLMRLLSVVSALALLIFGFYQIAIGLTYFT